MAIRLPIDPVRSGIVAFIELVSGKTFGVTISVCSDLADNGY